MKEMVASGLIDIQPHSKTHANLTLRLPDETDAKYRERMRREVDAPIRRSRTASRCRASTYAYPYGDVNETSSTCWRGRACSMGVTVTPGGNGFFAYPYMLRRSMVFGNEDLDAFKSKLVDVRAHGGAMTSPMRALRFAGCHGRARRARRVCAGARRPPDAGRTRATTRRVTISRDRADAIAQHRQHAEPRKQAGDLAAAAAQWQILALLAPRRRGFRARARVRREPRSPGVREQLQAGNAALRGGDTRSRHGRRC